MTHQRPRADAAPICYDGGDGEMPARHGSADARRSRRSGSPRLAVAAMLAAVLAGWSSVAPAAESASRQAPGASAPQGRGTAPAAVAPCFAPSAVRAGMRTSKLRRVPSEADPCAGSTGQAPNPHPASAPPR